jgi:hypothetical protein
MNSSLYMCLQFVPKRSYFEELPGILHNFIDMTRFKNTLTEITGKGALTQSIKKRLLTQGKLNPAISF